MESLIALIIVVLGIYVFIRLLPTLIAIIAILFLLAVVVTVINRLKNPTERTEDSTSTSTQGEPSVIDVEYTEEDIVE